MIDEARSYLKLCLHNTCFGKAAVFDHCYGIARRYLTDLACLCII